MGYHLHSDTILGRRIGWAATIYNNLFKFCIETRPPSTDEAILIPFYVTVISRILQGFCHNTFHTSDAVTVHMTKVV